MSGIAIFASGSGTNAENIIRYFNQRPSSVHRVELVLSNKIDAGVIKRSEKMGVPAKVFSRDEFYKTKNLLSVMQEKNCDFVVLAGFLWLVPSYIIRAFPDKILNIHPALLPKYGGKGMYGHHVHEAVIANGEKESGITIHRVNEQYDEGDIVFQSACSIKPTDSPDSLAEKVHHLEYKHFPRIIEEVIEGRL